MEEVSADETRRAVSVEERFFPRPGRGFFLANKGTEGLVVSVLDFEEEEEGFRGVEWSRVVGVDGSAVIAGVSPLMTVL